MPFIALVSFLSSPGILQLASNVVSQPLFSPPSGELFCKKISYYGIQPLCLVSSPSTPLPAFYSSHSELNAAHRTCPVLISTECFPPTGLPFSVLFLLLPPGLLFKSCTFFKTQTISLEKCNFIGRFLLPIKFLQFWVKWVHFASFYQMHFLMICLFPR